MLCLVTALLLGARGDAESAHGAGSTGAGAFRAIHHFVPHKSIHGARHGMRLRSNSTAVTVDRPGLWHSQSGQDQTIALLTARRTGGFFVDLAANDPVVLSNTRSLERDFKWSGICIDGNQAMLDKLVVQRSCTVVKGIVTSASGKTVEFTSPTRAGTWEDAMGGIMSSGTDNKQTRPGYAKMPWGTRRETTVTLVEILDHLQAPREIDYLSLDIEGAEYDALAAFDFAKYRFRYLTIERPNVALRALLRSNGYVYLVDHGCFGDQMWAHESVAAEAASTLGVTRSSEDRSVCHGSLPVLGRAADQMVASLADLRSRPLTQCEGPPILVECCGAVGGNEALESCQKEHAAGRRQ